MSDTVRLDSAPSIATVGRQLKELNHTEAAVWVNPARADWRPDPFMASAMLDAGNRFRRFAPLLAHFFSSPKFDGRIRSSLFPYSGSSPVEPLFIKADHALPIAGSIKARGGIHEVLHFAERVSVAEKLISDTSRPELSRLLEPAPRRALGRYRVVVGSTGNLGFSVGLIARQLGLGSEVHMSREAAAWKKRRLRAIGVEVVEHDLDFTGAVNAARQSSLGDQRAHFIDDETSPWLFAGYAAAAYEVAAQLRRRGLRPSPSFPLVTYLPCGVGGGPGGITFGLKRIFGAKAVIAVLAEPISSACMYLALASNWSGGTPPSVYDAGLDNRTEADGLAVARASPLALRLVGGTIDTAVALPDSMMREWVRRAHDEADLRLELSASAGFAAMRPAWAALGKTMGKAIHLVWTTGGSLLPDEEFLRIFRDAPKDEGDAGAW